MVTHIVFIHNIKKFVHKIYLNVFKNRFTPVFYPTVIPSFQKSRLVRSIQKVV